MEGSDAIGKVSGAALRGLQIASAWSVCFVKKKATGFALRKAKKKLDAATSMLGMEIYALYRRGEGEILNSPLITGQLQTVQEAESRLLDLQARADAIEEEYRKKKNAVSAKQG